MDAATAPAPDAADLARRLRESEAELARVTLRLHRLESSTAVQLARLLAAAVRNPRTGLAHLPRAAALVLRRRRGRGRRPEPVPKPAAGAGRSAGGAGAARGGPPVEGVADRLLAASAVLVTTRDRPVLAVVADAAAGRAWGEDAHVQLLRPDDAAAVFTAVAPDLLVVDAAAGRGGPWSGLGTYAVPARDRVVLDLLGAARERGIPAVLVLPPAEQDAPMLADARRLFAGSARPGAAVGDLVAAGKGSE